MLPSRKPNGNMEEEALIDKHVEFANFNQDYTFGFSFSTLHVLMLRKKDVW